jgi:hypothetical protein
MSTASGIPLSCCVPRLSYFRPDPVDRSRTIRVTSTSPASANAPTRAPVYRHAAPLLAAFHAFTEVNARAYVNRARSQCRYQLERTPSGVCRPIEKRENTVAGVLGANTAVPGQHVVNNFVMGVELVSPVRITERAKLFGGAHDIGEEHCLENALALWCAWLFEYERKGLCNKAVDDIEGVVRPGGLLLKSGIWNVCRESGRRFKGYKLITPPGNDQCGCSHLVESPRTSISISACHQSRASVGLVIERWSLPKS